MVFYADMSIEHSWNEQSGRERSRQEGGRKEGILKWLSQPNPSVQISFLHYYGVFPEKHRVLLKRQERKTVQLGGRQNQKAFTK